MKNSLSKKGLSLSQAQSVSNIAFQRAIDIQNNLSVVNNYSRLVNVNGLDYEETQGNKLPDNVVELIGNKARYHAAQAFLMENIKAKDALLESLRSESLVYEVEAPEMGDLPKLNLIPQVGDEWAREQLSLDEVNESLLKEAEAAHYGQFIHKNSPLDRLRAELPTIKTLEWMEIEAGKKSPVKIVTHHTSAQLSSLYEEFSALHRVAEQRVNYYKAKMKNLITAENARIAEVNSAEMVRVNALSEVVREVYLTASSKYRADYSIAKSDFEAKRNKKIQEASALRINVKGTPFEETINEILGTLETEK